MASDYEHLVARHYGRPDVRRGLEGVVDLAGVDQFHTRGEQATLDLAALARIEPRHHVLDLGGGLGGAARLLAARIGCTVTVVDLTEEFVRRGVEATERAGLSDRVRFRTGSALELPFDAAQFDRVLTQHVSMNVADKERLYAEARRVLRPGGWLGVHEIVAGPAAPPRFPVPWARDPELSWLRSHAEFRRLFRDLGFEELVWVDESGLARRWFEARADALRRASPDARPPGVHLLMGDDAVTMLENVGRNLAERRVDVVMAVLLVP